MIVLLLVCLFLRCVRVRVLYSVANSNTFNRCIRIGIDPLMNTRLPNLASVQGISTTNTRRSLDDSTCDYVMLDDSVDDPWKYSTPGAAPLWPYPLGEIMIDETSGKVASKLTWEQCLDRCRNTVGCVYVYWPDRCGNTWTGEFANTDFSEQCFMYNSYHPDPANDKLFQDKPSSVTKWMSSDWCYGSLVTPPLPPSPPPQPRPCAYPGYWCRYTVQFGCRCIYHNHGNNGRRLGLNMSSSEVEHIMRGETSKRRQDVDFHRKTYKHAYSSCYDSEFVYQTHTFGDPNEVTSSIEIKDLN